MNRLYYVGDTSANDCGIEIGMKYLIVNTYLTCTEEYVTVLDEKGIEHEMTRADLEGFTHTIWEE